MQLVREIKIFSSSFSTSYRKKNHFFIHKLLLPAISGCDIFPIKIYYSHKNCRKKKFYLIIILLLILITLKKMHIFVFFFLLLVLVR